MLLVALCTMLLASAVSPAITARLGRMAGYPLAGVFVATAVLVLAEAGEVLAGGVVEESVRWVPTFGAELSLRLTGLGLLFAMLVLGVGALIMSYAPQYLSAQYEHGRLYSILTLFAGGMLGLVLAGDLILLLVFWELTTICSFLLVAGRGTTGSRPATRALVVTGSGGLALLGAVVLLVARTGSSDVDVVLASAPAALSETDLRNVALLVVLAAFTKSAQLPFHFWLPGAMVAITPVSAYLHAATLVKGGIYLLLLFSPLFAEFAPWHLTLMTVGLASMVFGAYQALRQHDLKALLAYSTVSQLGLMVALVGIGTSASLGAATLLVAAHALFKATLFMLVGIIDREAGSRDIRQLGGLRRAMPVTAGLTGLAAMSMAGIPPLVGFVAKEEAFYAFLGTSEASWAGGVAASGWLAAGVAVAGTALTFAYSARIIVGAFAGPLRQESLYEPRAAFLAPAAIPAALGLVLGLEAWLLNAVVDRAVLDTGFGGSAVDLALWHGLTPALGLSVLAITLGGVIHLRRNRTALDPQAPAPRMIGPDLFDRGWDALLRLGAGVGRPVRSLAAGPHLAGVLVLLVALGAGAAQVVGDLPPARPDIVQPSDWVVLALLLPAVAALSRAGDGMAALVLSGAVGLIMAGWLIILGAPDVALTLLLVEVLTVVVAAPVLARLPDRGAHRRRPAAALAAVVSGALVGGLVLLATGRRERSELADYFLAEAEPATGGSNVVNTILVDFRGLDTLGEVVVLAAAALALLALPARPRTGRPVGSPALPSWRPGGRSGAPTAPIPAGTLGPGELMVLRVGSVVVLPLIGLAAIVLFVRGHDQPGGGFIAGLVAGAGLAAGRLAGVPLRIPPAPRLVAAGLAVALGAAVTGLVLGGSVLEPVKLPGGFASTSLVFDLGVLMIVVGLVQSGLDSLAPRHGPAPSRERAPDAEVGT